MMGGATWEGKAIVEVKGVKAEQVWPFLEDFCNLHNYFPSLATCRHEGGEQGRPGMIRYCASAPEQGSVMWARERLLEIDPVGRWMRYEVVDSNMGLRNYVATARTAPCRGGAAIEWSFECDPVEGSGPEDLQAYLQTSLRFMAANIFHTLNLP